MRITLHGMIQRVVGNVQNRIERLGEVQRQMSTGLRVEKPSDNPIAATEMLQLQSLMNRGDQFKRNIEYSIMFLETTQSSLNQINDSLISIRADAIRGANDALSTEDRAAIADYIDQRMREILSNVNQKHLGRYLFGGTKIDRPPYRAGDDENGRLSDVEPQFNAPLNAFEHIVGEGERREVSFTADDVLDLGEGETIFGLLTELRQAFEDDDAEGIGNMLDRIDLAVDQISSLLGTIGSRTNSLMALRDQIDSQKTVNSARYSQLADVDIVEAISMFQEEQNAYELALRTAASAIQPSLVNFIRF